MNDVIVHKRVNYPYPEKTTNNYSSDIDDT